MPNEEIKYLDFQGLLQYHSNLDKTNKVVASALNNLDERIVSTSKDLEQTSKSLEEANKVISKAINDLDARTLSNSKNIEENSKSLEDSDKVISKAINDLDYRLLSLNNNNLSKILNITWKKLKSLRDNKQLITGQLYRIIDYITTTTQMDTKSAEHPFDIIVTADTESLLNENARACLSDRDIEGYFSKSNLAAWEIKYCIDNDSSRFLWADPENGRGVIYRMKDECNNSLPYDFKNIMFKRVINHNDIFKDEEDNTNMVNIWDAVSDWSDYVEFPWGIFADHPIYNPSQINDGDERYAYTFSSIDLPEIYKDASRLKSKEYDNLQYGETYIHDNYFEELHITVSKDGILNIPICLPNITILELFNNNYTLSFHNNYFGGICRNLCINARNIQNSTFKDVHDSIIYGKLDRAVFEDVNWLAIDITTNIVGSILKNIKSCYFINTFINYSKICNLYNVGSQEENLGEHIIDFSIITGTIEGYDVQHIISIKNLKNVVISGNIYSIYDNYEGNGHVTFIESMENCQVDGNIRLPVGGGIYPGNYHELYLIRSTRFTGNLFGIEALTNGQEIVRYDEINVSEPDSPIEKIVTRSNEETFYYVTVITATGKRFDPKDNLVI